VTAKDLTRQEIDQLNGRVGKILKKGAYQRKDLLDEIHQVIARQAPLGVT